MYRYWHETDHKREKAGNHEYQWSTNIELNTGNLEEMIEAGRGRWKILYEFWFYTNFSGQKPHTYCIAA